MPESLRQARECAVTRSTLLSHLAWAILPLCAVPLRPAKEADGETAGEQPDAADGPGGHTDPSGDIDHQGGPQEP
ncbi:MAG: hypothetical protein V7633_272 [Pseudonocardia sp.]